MGFLSEFFKDFFTVSGLVIGLIGIVLGVASTKVKFNISHIFNFRSGNTRVDKSHKENKRDSDNSHNENSSITLNGNENRVISNSPGAEINEHRQKKYLPTGKCRTVDVGFAGVSASPAQEYYEKLKNLEELAMRHNPYSLKIEQEIFKLCDEAEENFKSWLMPAIFRGFSYLRQKNIKEGTIILQHCVDEILDPDYPDMDYMGMARYIEQELQKLKETMPDLT